MFCSFCSVVDPHPDPHHFGNLDPHPDPHPDPHRGDQWNPDPHQRDADPQHWFLVIIAPNTLFYKPPKILLF